jgi:hypothetical protein
MSKVIFECVSVGRNALTSEFLPRPGESGRRFERIRHVRTSPRQASSPRTATMRANWWTTIPDASGFTTCVIVSHRSSFGLRRIRRRCRLCCDTAMSKMTLQWYTHTVSEDRMAAEGAMLMAILGRATRTECGRKADQGALTAS